MPGSALHGTEQGPAIVGARREAVCQGVGSWGAAFWGAARYHAGGGCTCMARP